MRKLVSALLGIALGACLSLLLAAAVVFVFPLITGAGGDEMSQGIMGTLVVGVSAPILGLIGAIIGYRMAP